MIRRGSAEWKGSLKEGQGTLSSESGALNHLGYSFGKRFGDEPGTNPEELVGAAHAACFSMATSAQLGEMGFTPDYVRTTANVKLEKTDSGFAITTIHLETHAKVPNADKESFDRAVNNAKGGCPISKLLQGAEITLDAHLD